MDKKTYLNEYYHNVKKRKDILNVYRAQLKEFKSIGLGGRTRFGTLITEQLIAITMKRLGQLEKRLVRQKYTVKAVA